MDYKNKIVFKEVRGREFFRLKSIMRRYFKFDAKKILQVRENKRLYQVILSNDTSVRLDVYDITSVKFKKINRNCKLLNIKRLNYPKIFSIVNTPDSIYKASKWIEGSLLKEVWNRPNVIKTAGVAIAKINMIKEEKSGKNLSFTNFNREHAIWSAGDELYLIGDHIFPVKDVNQHIARMIKKNLQKTEIINWFLAGYKTIKPIYGIQKILNDMNEKNIEQNNDNPTIEVL